MIAATIAFAKDRETDGRQLMAGYFPVPTRPKTNTLAIVSLASSFCVSLVAVITGHIALRQIRARGDGGRGLAIAGLAIGYCGLLVGALFSAGLTAAYLNPDSGVRSAVESSARDLFRTPTGSTGSVVYPGSANLADVAGPSTAQTDGGIPVGARGVAGETPASGGVVVTVYQDYACPACLKFEKANDAELAKLRATGRVTVEYHAISILDRMSSGHEYSTRAANAAAVVADEAPDSFLAFNAALFANQPPEGSTGLSDDRIASAARGAGVPQKVVDQFTATAPGQKWRTFSPYVKALTHAANAQLGSSGGVPTVFINGTRFDGNWLTAGELTSAIVAAER
jgi:protein-disulfide isomerase